MNIFTRIKEYKAWGDQKESLLFLVKSILLYSFLPVWITIFLLFLTGHLADIGDIWSKGAFFIYSASLLYSATEMMEGYLKKGTVTIISWLYPASWFLIILSAIGFAVAIVPDIFSTGNFVDGNAITWTSSIFLGISILIIYYSHYRDHKRPDPEGRNQQLQGSIMDRIS